MVKQTFIIIVSLDYISALQQHVAVHPMITSAQQMLNPFTPELSIRHHRSCYIYSLGHGDFLMPVICLSASLF